MKKLLATSCAIFASIELFATAYIFTGEVSGELTNIANWATVNSNPSNWSAPYTYTYGNYANATSLPTSSEVIGIGTYNFKNEDGTDNIQKPTPLMSIATSFSSGNIEYRSASGNSSTVSLGSAGHADEDFVLSAGNFLSGSWGGRTINFVKAADASQKTYSLSFKEFALCQDSYIFGSVETGALDKISSTYMYLWWSGVNLTTYVKNIEINGNLNINRDNTAGSNSWKIIVPDAVLNGESAMINVSGTLSKATAQLLDLDFANAVLEDNTKYLLISAAVTSGFDAENAANDFNVSGLKDGYSLSWDNNSLFLTTAPVPESASIAGIFGALALALAIARRNRRK